MCGICGVFDRKGIPIGEGIIENMMASIQHRGPNGFGKFQMDEIALGHRRLSIIDLEGGAQPISNEDKSLQIVFNGEIYNYKELRSELENLGHTFHTQSDTETIVHAFEQWGIDCVNHFNGMFAFAIWNSVNHSLFLARDHLGIKPLYYIELDSTILFASEIKALLEYPSVPKEIDIKSLSELFTFRYVPSPNTLFKGIKKLIPGHIMICSKTKIDIKRFWTWTPIIRSSYNENELIEEYQSLFEDTIRLQMRSDVPVGLFLSSGIDSSAILALMRQHTSKPINTYTIGFTDGEKTNEIRDAAKLAHAYGANHHGEIISPHDYASYYEQYMMDLEEPVGHEPAAAHYFVANLAAQHTRVALSGQGADEPWAGYDRYLGIKYSEIYRRIPTPIINILAPLLSKIPGKLEIVRRSVNSLSEPDHLTRFAKVYSYFSADMKEQLYRGKLRQDFDVDNFGTKEALRRLQSDVKHLDPLSQMLYIDTRANLPDDLLMVGDKTSMSNSLEVRVPFLDYRIVEFIESLPPSLKLRGLTGKYLHKKAMRKYLPSEVVYRKKKGFAHPIAQWLRTSMRPLVEDCLLSKNSSLSEYFNIEYIRTILELDRSGSENYMRHIYLLLSLELWHRKFITR